MKRHIDLDLLRDRLSVAQGKRYWRSLEELAAHPDFEEMLHREFPREASVWSGDLSRRKFLGLMGASLALAGLAGCHRRPSELIMPYTRQPEGMVPGKPLYYATAMSLGGYATGLLVETHEGRPTKIEGNPEHPASLGATDAYCQAAVLGLYDPDRSQTVNYRGRVRTWDGAVGALRQRLGGRRAKGRGVAVLTGLIGSPTLAWQLDGFFKDYPEARWYQYEPAGADGARAAALSAFGQPAHAYYRVDQADVIVALDADFLGCGPGSLAYSRRWASRRRDKSRMNRLYAVESSFTVTGGSADNRLPLPPSQVARFAWALAAKLGVPGLAEVKLEGEAGRWVDAVAKDLKRPAGATLVVAGPGQPAAVHLLAHAMNDRLGNLGKTVVVTAPVLPRPPRMSDMEYLKKLATDVEKGEVDTLLVLGGNPAYAAPADVPFADLLTKKLEDRDWLAVRLGQYFDETSRLCHWHLPETHFLESWSDAVAYDGTASVVQPLIAPLYAGRPAHELVAALSKRRNGGGKSAGDYDERSAHELVRDYWRERRPDKGGDFERFWQKAVHDGVIAGTKAREAGLKFSAEKANLAGLSPPARAATGLELVFAPDPAVYDGRFANNGWLQELPKPLTKLTWDNAALMSPKTAEALGVGLQKPGRRGGEHGQMKAAVVRLSADGRELEAPVFVLPGHPDGAVTLHLGYGRTRAGKVGTGAGFNANALRTTRDPHSVASAEATKIEGKTYTLACTQGHWNMAGRDPVRSGTLAEYRADKHFATRRDEKHAGPGEHAHGGRVELPTLYAAYKYDGYKWGMAIDLSTCTGCSACVVACQSENNIPVVGKGEVTRGREMHWLRIDRYFETREEEPADELRVHHQPLMCVHCEHAPCELVCPVEATVHGDEGTNDMVYNRCVGTRYCANNCPYKVRRFNFLQYADYHTPSLKLMYNPEVTVRTRGVMEKCTFCIQRISYARIEAAKEALAEADLPVAERKRFDPNRPGVAKIFDGEVVTACQGACPTNAIVFGDLNDPKSRVKQLHDSELRYDLLGELGTRPRAVHLAEVRNPNPELGAK